jgi:predicted DNA-binding transcriptional regulator YafY
VELAKDVNQKTGKRGSKKKFELRFEKPDDFNLRDYLQHTLGVFHEDGPPQRVKIRFAPEVARYITEHHWHATQKLTRLPDGALLAEFDLTSLEEIRSWILSFGAKAEALEPKGLRDRIAEEVKAFAEMYGGTEPSKPSKSIRSRR